MPSQDQLSLQCMDGMPSQLALCGSEAPSLERKPYHKEQTPDTAMDAPEVSYTTYMDVHKAGGPSPGKPMLSVGFAAFSR